MAILQEKISEEELQKRSTFVLKKNKPQKNKIKSGLVMTTYPYYPYTIWNNGRKVLHIEPSIKDPKQIGELICTMLNSNRKIKLMVETA